MTYFTKDKYDPLWDNCIYMKSINRKLGTRELLKDLPCGDGFIPKGFIWNGASSGIFAKVLILNFPKWKHPVATCRHDWRCNHAETAAQRKIADQQFKFDVGVGGTKWEQTKGYLGVRTWAILNQLRGVYK